MEVGRANGTRNEAREIPEAQLRGAQEIWLTSSTREVLAIVRLDDKPVGAGTPGPMFARMYALYQDYKSRVMRAG